MGPRNVLYIGFIFTLSRTLHKRLIVWSLLYINNMWDSSHTFWIKTALTCLNWHFTWLQFFNWCLNIMGQFVTHYVWTNTVSRHSVQYIQFSPFIFTWLSHPQFLVWISCPLEILQPSTLCSKGSSHMLLLFHGLIYWFSFSFKSPLVDMSFLKQCLCLLIIESPVPV